MFICFDELIKYFEFKADRPMLFTMPPSFYTTPSIPTPATLPPIPIIEDDFENIVTESADSLSTVTPKAKFYVKYFRMVFFSQYIQTPTMNIFDFQIISFELLH